MDEEFRNWLCELTEIEYTKNLFFDYSKLELLIKAMWAINKKYENISIEVTKNEIMVHIVHHGLFPYSFPYIVDKKPEEKALESALKYIYEEVKDG